MLLSKHTHLPITPVLAEKWLDLMEDSLEEFAEEIDEFARHIILDFLRFTAYFIIAGQEIEAKMRRQSTEFGEMALSFEV